MPETLEIGRKIGRGAYVDVFQGTLDGKPVAVKKIKTKEKIIGFSRQFALMKSLNHPNIVNYIGAYYNEETREPLLVIELMKRNLKEFLEIRDPLSVKDQCTYCQEIVKPLVYLHQRDPPIVHSCVTGWNILLSEDDKVKLGGCGRAEKNSFCGYFDMRVNASLDYTPPEVHTDNTHYDEKNDVFSLGVVFTQIITRHPPNVSLVKDSNSKEIERRQPDLSEIPEDHPLKPIILQCLQDNPVDRPNTVTVLEEIQKISHLSQRKHTCISML